MSTILHILNGDDTLHGFEQAGIDGDIMVWREVLSEGPLIENILSADFWKNRTEWMGKTFGADDYNEKVIAQLGKLNDNYDEINLWFEYDLHCQVNLLGVLMLLQQKVDISAPAVYLICPESHLGVENFRGMGQLNGEQLAELYEGRKGLNEPEFYIATEAWKLYVNNHAKALEQWINTNNYWGNLSLLKQAMQAHLKRLRLNEAGLNYIEQKLLNIYSSGTRQKQDIYNAFWQTGGIYGMGDAELNIYLQRLSNKGLISL